MSLEKRSIKIDVIKIYNNQHLHYVDHVEAEDEHAIFGYFELNESREMNHLKQTVICISKENYHHNQDQTCLCASII